MSPLDDETRNVAWRSWLSLAWMTFFGVLYLLMILREKAPGLLAKISAIG